MYASIFLDSFPFNYKYSAGASFLIDSPRVIQKLEPTPLVNFGCVSAFAFLVLWGMISSWVIYLS